MSTVTYFPTVSSGGASLDGKSLLQEQASAFLGPNFSDVFYDWMYNNVDVATAGFVGTTPAALVIGRTGGGKVKIDMNGVGGIYDVHESSGFQITAQQLVATGLTDPWMVAWGGSIDQVTATGEFAACALSRSPFTAAATDAGSTNYIYFGFLGTTSTTNLVVAAWNGSVKTVFTTSALIDLGKQHVLSLASDGLGTIYAMVDGVVVDTRQIVDIPINLPDIAQTQHFYRTTANGTHLIVTTDFIYGAGVRY